MHEVRTWAVSAVVSAGLLGLASWRFLPLAAATWVLVGLGWLALTAAVHLLLHNRWMVALDDRLQARLRRSAAAAAPGPAHATRRSPRASARALAGRSQPQAARSEPPSPAPVLPERTSLPSLRPVASRSSGATRYHRQGTSSGRARTGRAAHR